MSEKRMAYGYTDTNYSTSPAHAGLERIEDAFPLPASRR